MRFSVEKVEAFAKCPKYYRYLEMFPSSPRDKVLETCESVMKRLLMQATETGFRARWRVVVGLVDTGIFQYIDVTNQEQYKEARGLSERCLKSLQNWYHDIYLLEDAVSYSDLYLLKQIGARRHYLESTVPILQLSENVIVSTVHHVGLTAPKLYNNLYVRALAALVQDELDCDVVQCRSLGIGPLGGFEAVDVHVDRRANARVYKMLGELMDMMEKGVSYPSVTEMCDQCVFYRRCRL